MHKERLLAVMEAVLREPTAPFHRAAVRAAIADRLGGHPRPLPAPDDASRRAIEEQLSPYHHYHRRDRLPPQHP